MAESVKVTTISEKVFLRKVHNFFSSGALSFASSAESNKAALLAADLVRQFERHRIEN
jgi:hypothetical protein